MNRQDIEQKLKEIEFSNLTAPEGHKRQLRAALSAYAEQHKPSVFAWTKDTFKGMQMNFKVSSFVAGTLVGVLMIGGVQAANNLPILAKYNPFATPTAKAQAVVKESIFKAKQLSPEDRAKIEGKMKADMQGSLDEAYAAKDLRILTQDEMNLEKDGMFSFGVGKSGTDGKMMPEPIKSPEVQKYLKYTDSKGRHVTLGLNSAGLPILKMMQIQVTEGDKQKIDQEIQGTSGAGLQGKLEVNFDDVSASSTAPKAGLRVFNGIGVSGAQGNVMFNTEEEAK